MRRKHIMKSWCWTITNYVWSMNNSFLTTKTPENNENTTQTQKDQTNIQKSLKQKNNGS